MAEAMFLKGAARRLCRVCERPAAVHDDGFPCPEPTRDIVMTGDAVLLRSSKIVEQEGAIALPDSAKEKYQYHVLAIGADATNKHIKVGDRVIALGVLGIDWDLLPGFARVVVVRKSASVAVRWKRHEEQ